MKMAKRPLQRRSRCSLPPKPRERHTRANNLPVPQPPQQQRHQDLSLHVPQALMPPHCNHPLQSKGQRKPPSERYNANISSSDNGDEVTSDPESVSGGSNAPGQIGESTAASKRSSTRPTYQKGPAYKQKQLDRAHMHHMDTGRVVHDEQQHKAKQFTGVKGHAALQAYSQTNGRACKRGRCN